MALPKPQYIANQIVQECNNENFEELENVIFRILQNRCLNMSDEERWEYIELYKKDIANELFSKENDSEIDGLTPNFKIEEDHGNYHVKFFDNVETQLLRQLQRNTSQGFECFCSNILQKIGGNSRIIGGCDDGGCDFYATDLKLGGLPRLSNIGSRILVIGQAKRYKNGNHVTLKELREFVGSSMKKIDELKKENNKLGILHPTILAFWTTSDFHPEAKIYARNIGIWYLNGIALCQLAKELNLETPS